MLHIKSISKPPNRGKLLLTFQCHVKVNKLAMCVGKPSLWLSFFVYFHARKRLYKKMSDYPNSSYNDTIYYNRTFPQRISKNLVAKVIFVPFEMSLGRTCCASGWLQNVTCDLDIKTFWPCRNMI